MNNFLRSGRDMAVGQNGVRPVADDKELSSRPINPNNRQFQPLGRPRSDEDRGSLRTTFGQASHLVRPMFGKCLSIVYLFSIDSLSILYVFLRERIEKHKGEDRETPKLVRRSREAGSKDSQKITEKGARRIQPTPINDLARTCLYTGYEQEIPKRETRITLERTKDKTRNTQETPKRKTRIRQESRNPTTKNTPERYCKGTGKVLNSGGKGTGEILESYQRNTKEVLTISRSGVAFERDGGKSARHCAAFRPVGNWNAMERSDLLDRLSPFTRKDGEVVDDLRVNRLILKGFHLLCEKFRGKVEPMVVDEKINREKGLKCVGDFEGKSKPMVYSLQLIILFYVLFSLTLAPKALGQGAIGLNKIQPLRIGDTIPDSLMYHRMPIYLDTIGRDTVSLADFAAEDRVLIIDFWPVWCSPCVKSVLRLDSISRSKQYKNIRFLSVNVIESEERLHRFIQRTQFGVPTLYDFSFLVNRLLTRYAGYYGLLMIKGNRILGAPDKRTLTVENLDRIEKGNWDELTVSYLPELKKIEFAKEVGKGGRP